MGRQNEALNSHRAVLMYSIIEKIWDDISKKGETVKELGDEFERSELASIQIKSIIEAIQNTGADPIANDFFLEMANDLREELQSKYPNFDLTWACFDDFMWAYFNAVGKDSQIKTKIQLDSIIDLVKKSPIPMTDTKRWLPFGKSKKKKISED